MLLENTLFITHCAATWALAGLIWTVQIIIYPQFERVGREEFPAYHASHMNRMSFVVGPLMLIEVTTAGWLFFFFDTHDPLFLASLALLPVHLISTAFIQVPLHKKLERDGLNPQVSTRLTQTNWLRTAAWTLRALLLAWILATA